MKTLHVPSSFCFTRGHAMLVHLAAVLVVAAAMPPAPQHGPGPNMPRIGATYSGFGTYYGEPPMEGNSHVHCHLPNVDDATGYASISRTIAVNRDQYMGSRACGMCAEVWGSGYMCPGGQRGPDCGLGNEEDKIQEKFVAVITDELVERKSGDIDIGEYGDGHYPVTWRPIACPWDDHRAKVVLHAGANNWYLKVQFRYLNSPMESVQLLTGAEEVGHSERTHDNFFRFEAKYGDGWKYDGNGELLFKAKSTLGTWYCGKINRALRAEEDYEYDTWKC